MVVLLIASLSALTLLFLSYFWLDHAIMFILSLTKPYVLQVDVLREYLVHNRETVTMAIYALVTILLLVQVYVFLRKVNKKYLVATALIVTLFTTIAYPLLSHDIFSYIFYSKILVTYQQNPYSVLPETFRDIDMWLSFVHWTHKTYLYGPISLIYSSIPIILFGGSRLIMIFFGMKLLNGILFLATGVFILKLTRNVNKTMALWFLNPLLLFELLINAHNELLMIFLFIAGAFLIEQKKYVIGWLSVVLSILSKFVSGVYAPALLLKGDWREKYVKVISLAALIYFGLKFQTDIQAWYYTWLFMAIPFIKLKKHTWLVIILSGSLLLYTKYLPFVRFANWNQMPSTHLLSYYFLALPFILVFLESKYFNTVSEKLGLSSAKV
jgi:hypothetical protein